MKPVIKLKTMSLICSIALWASLSSTPVYADNSDDLLKSCQSMLQLKDFNLTVQICSSGINLFPARTEFYLVRGFAYGNLNQNTAALTDFNKVLASFPQHLDTLFYRGNIYAALGEPEKALADFSAVLKLDSKASLVLYRRADIYTYLGQFELAKKNIQAILALQPNEPTAQQGLAQIEERLKPFVYRGKSLSNPDMYIQEVNLQAQLNSFTTGPINLMKGQGDAYALLSECVSRFPDNYSCNKVLLSYYESDKIMSTDFAKSQMAKWIDQNLMRIYSVVLRQETKNASVYFGRGLKYFYDFKNDAMAIKDFSQAIQYAVPAPYFYFTLRGQAYLQSKQYDLAIADFSSAMKSNPRDYEAYSFRSKTFESIKKYDDALNDINKAIEFAHFKDSLMLSRARLYTLKKDLNAALLELNDILKRTPKYQEALAERANVYRALGKTDLAAKDDKLIEEIKKQLANTK